jgi:glyoxylase-like metal-dependent hydrolase (beta-lactamase superfamily II)
MKLQRFTYGPFAENSYLIVGRSGRKAALVDPGLDSEPLLDVLQEQGLALEWIINTHGHLDHVAANAFFKTHTAARLILHPADEPLLQRLVDQGRLYGFELQASPAPDEYFDEARPFGFDELEFEVIHTPGHSPGGVCLRWGMNMIVGDTLFNGSIGRTDLAGGSFDELRVSIRDKLFRLPGDTICHPGHGPETTLAAERRSNPFVGDAAVGATIQESQ